MQITRFAGNKIDLLLSNWPVMIEHVSTLIPEESTFPSDHYLVNFSIRLKFKLKFNASKCKVLTITRKKSPVITDHRLHG